MKTIGIVGFREMSRNYNYYNAVEACGVQTMPLDLYGGTDSVGDLDGIVLPGGTDVNPALYHEGNTASRQLDKRLDWFELAVISEAVKYEIPVFGICRGHQLINVFFGGSLIQNVDHCGIHDYCKDKSDRVHGGRVVHGSFLFEVYGKERIVTNSAHHQAVHRIGEKLDVAEYSDDGLIEAVYHTELPIFGVQWHPERMCLNNARDDTEDGLRIFEYFVNHIVQGKPWNGGSGRIEYYI